MLPLLLLLGEESERAVRSRKEIEGEKSPMNLLNGGERGKALRGIYRGPWKATANLKSRGPMRWQLSV
jgi:hypothetical protein